jgi:hypothetical protein
MEQRGAPSRALLERMVAAQAAMGAGAARRQMKRWYPQREFRAFHCDLRGAVLKWRRKGSKAAWKVFAPQ